MPTNLDKVLPILAHKHYDTPSTFTPKSHLRKARWQERLLDATVPAEGILDPDGDIVWHLKSSARAGDLGYPPCNL
jgi:uridine phosphorylase